MYNISGFLQKFLNLEKNNDVKLSVILDTIEKETNIKLPNKALEIKGDNLKINCSPVFRNEIFMHKTEIENQLKISKIFLKII
jgi:hypothetical protein